MTVYVQKPQAHVNLASEFLPGNLQDISLDVTVTANGTVALGCSSFSVQPPSDILVGAPYHSGPRAL